MRKKQPKNIDRIFADGRPIDRALRLAARQAVLLHRASGKPMPVWRNGKTVWIDAHDVKLPSAR